MSKSTFDVGALLHSPIPLLLLLSISLLCRGSCDRFSNNIPLLHLCAAVLNFRAVYTWGRLGVYDSAASLVAALDVHILEIEGVYVAGNVAE